MMVVSCEETESDRKRERERVMIKIKSRKISLKVSFTRKSLIKISGWEGVDFSRI